MMSVVKLNVVILSVFLLSAFMLGVVAPFYARKLVD
jgi:hypothetical protein